MGHSNNMANIKSTMELKAAMEQADAIVGLEGYERSAGMKALDNAMLAGRASLKEVGVFVDLNAKMVGARSVLSQLKQDDPRRAVIESRYQEQLEQLQVMAVNMDGAVRVAFGL